MTPFKYSAALRPLPFSLALFCAGPFFLHWKITVFEGCARSEGGFAAAEDATGINWMILVKNAPVAVSKTDVTRIFDPMTNQNANAWKIDYRKYHDLWIMDNGMDGVLVSVGE